MARAQLYRHYDACGDLLYVGVSLSVIARLKQHRCKSHWFYDIARIDVEVFPDETAALRAEAIAIRTEHPRHNIMGRRNSKHVPKRPKMLARKQSVIVSPNSEIRVVTLNLVYTIQEAAEVLRITTSRLKEEIASGRIRAIRIGREPDEVESVVRGRGRPATLISGQEIKSFIEWRMAEVSKRLKIAESTLYRDIKGGVAGLLKKPDELNDVDIPEV